jgi:hypothetical protein
MATIHCDEFANYLEPWLAGERHPDAQSHVRDCPRCRSLVEDLNLIQATARQWGGEQVEPPARVWTSLRAKLEEEGLIREAGRQRRWFNGWFNILPRPVLAGAYLAVLVAVGFGLSGPVSTRINKARWHDSVQATTMGINKQIAPQISNTTSSLPQDSKSVVTASLRQNLDIVDNYIQLCEKSINEEPENELARDFLYDAYQQKADLLAQMSDRGGNVQ